MYHYRGAESNEEIKSLIPLLSPDIAFVCLSLRLLLLLTVLEDDEGVGLEAALGLGQAQCGVGQQAVLGSTGRGRNTEREGELSGYFRDTTPSYFHYLAFGADHKKNHARL